MVEVLCVDISRMGEEEYRVLFDRASPARQARAERYLRWEDRLRCVVADGLIRYVVKKALGLSEFTVAVDDLGKPYIQGQEGFYFNLSHSGDWVVIAYGDCPVGIDVQQMRSDCRREQRISKFFAEDEAAYILGGGNRFWEIWTAKESYLKYLGVGLRKDLDSFSVLPDGAHLGVWFQREFFGDYCMTVCAAGEIGSVLRMDGAAFI